LNRREKTQEYGDAAYDRDIARMGLAAAGYVDEAQLHG
jgi:hypothetical protein